MCPPLLTLPIPLQLGYTALVLAAMEGHKEVVKVLLGRGAHLEAKSRVRPT